MSANTDLIRVTHYGTVHFGADVECEALVLANGERGFNRRQVMRVVGFRNNNPSTHFRSFLAEIAPKSLVMFDKTESPVIMPHGGNARFIPCDVIPDFAAGVIRQAVTGTLHQKRRGLIEPCLAIQESLAKVGIASLIDEATGYQYHRAPDALQDLFTRLIRLTAADWERRFHPDFYEAIYRLFGWKYHPAKPKPHIIGKITLQWVYEPVFPPEILIEIKERQGSDKMHQWLTAEGGLQLMEKQRDAVMMIARSSTDHPDFEARCRVAFFKKGQLPILYPQEARG
ncbi:P63C domain-containing protein [Candidatus Contendibacter odensensis]|uniref:Bacteriophage Mx8 p63 C-terminal domain-containing protein n=1 Tax=Candidatus Contendobacter odensis Run_B_J11 TaxID=1400861 RepID=A0A7U7GAH7_9GAMM|nr:P63C domain-containing protein [Candidatus Contendobacter odensis]MBK8752277.1 hypothetical protein [Candidatus Competibacteraceae bacterium]CDH44749.1 conserved hypothetical protein [Candidatus Contendobacter odensis Run_B_J11]